MKSHETLRSRSAARMGGAVRAAAASLVSICPEIVVGSSLKRIALLWVNVGHGAGRPWLGPFRLSHDQRLINRSLVRA